eukprot:TRINITY_DN2288_c0_g1_i1.p1 TRINITY_DN2288_c0_g1~~TRINITY_DN2288_c0_g1_i1.p1  ORF type:complete len:164 (-),score=51.69 TRINITY_DN2288_c0_g1_i1:18-509(-)
MEEDEEGRLSTKRLEERIRELEAENRELKASCDHLVEQNAMWQHYVGSILHDRTSLECSLSPQGKTLEIRRKSKTESLANITSSESSSPRWKMPMSAFKSGSASLSSASPSAALSVSFVPSTLGELVKEKRTLEKLSRELRLLESEMGGFDEKKNPSKWQEEV